MRDRSFRCPSNGRTVAPAARRARNAPHAGTPSFTPPRRWVMIYAGPSEAVMDVGDWLRNQGLGRYEKAFRENAIDLDVLPDLTDGDLAQIGVAFGDRKRLLKAIASFPPPGLISPADGSAPRPA